MKEIRSYCDRCHTETPENLLSSISFLRPIQGDAPQKVSSELCPRCVNKFIVWLTAAPITDLPEV